MATKKTTALKATADQLKKLDKYFTLTEDIASKKKERDPLSKELSVVFDDPDNEKLFNEGVVIGDHKPHFIWRREITCERIK